jgi:hypothetical protein
MHDSHRASFSDTQEHRREDHDLQQADRDEHERVHGITHDGFLLLKTKCPLAT